MARDVRDGLALPERVKIEGLQPAVPMARQASSVDWLRLRSSVDWLLSTLLSTLLHSLSLASLSLSSAKRRAASDPEATDGSSRLRENTQQQTNKSQFSMCCALSRMRKKQLLTRERCGRRVRGRAGRSARTRAQRGAGARAAHLVCLLLRMHRRGTPVSAGPSSEGACRCFLREHKERTS
eukprot:546263-Rhodomonas_salina.2